MNALLRMGKALTLIFWLVFVAALTKRIGAPFEQLVYLLAGCLALLHVAQLWLFSSLVSARGNPWLERVQILMFGIFHLYSLKVPQPSDAGATPAIEEAAHA